MNTPPRGIHMHQFVVAALVAASAAALYAQAPKPVGKSGLPATDVTATETKAFIDKLPKNAISDLPIRVAEVGTGHIGIYGVFRPKSVKQDAVLHEVTTTEVYYMLEGTGTLVTGGRLKDERREPPTTTTVRGSGIDGGLSRKVAPGDVIIIPGRTPHWWSSLDGDIRYMIIRADPDRRIPLKP
jgi:mannose-6-phosphate isomerase-like protein (cupin superfamily)